MTKQLVSTLAITLPLFAQSTPSGNAFQQSDWLRGASGSGILSFNTLDGQSGPVLGKPLSANEVRTTVQLLSDGSHIRSTETERFYRDAQGRMRTETSTGAVIYDPVASFSYDLTNRNKTYTRSANISATITIAAAAHYSSVGSSNPPHQDSRAAQTEDLTPQYMDGIYVKGSRVTITIPAGTIGNDHDLKVINERWYSDDLKLLVKSINSDPRFGTTTYEITNVSQSAPDPSLFQPPSDYREERHH
jgi:hypothetical protein